ncbi:MAG: antibiotic biosynthesis monooxygenase [Proteobacteria bacterium]|nr:antibiotic biosynthesis monooxygenase [Pseudomonadota bacterium]
MSQVAVTALLTITPGLEAEFEALLAPLVTATRAEQGCLRYEPHRTEEIGRYCILEQWQSQEHLDRHLDSEHIATFRQASAKSLGAAEITVWRAFDPA